jgi:ParB/RepB/Spo0J family partition protein
VSALAAVADVPRETPRVEPYLANIVVDRVDVATNVRVDVGDLTELKASIEELGVLEPIVVTEQFGPKGKHGYRLVVGQRRLTACRELGRALIPAIVHPASDVDEPGVRRSIEQLAENLIRKDLNAIEEAVALRAVLDTDPELTQAELARRLGMSASWVANALRLLGLASKVQDGIRSGEISASHGKVLAVLPEKFQNQLAKRIVDDKISSHQLESEIRWKQQEADQEEARRKRTDKVTPKAIAALEAAGVPKDARIWVQGPYDINDGQVNSAIRKAGWKGAKPEYIYDSAPRTETCTCSAWKLELGGRAPSLKPICIVVAHQPERENPHEAWKVAQAEREAQAELRRTAVQQLVEGASLSTTLLKVLAWSVESWHRDGFEVATDQPDQTLVAQIASAIAQRTRDEHEAMVALLSIAVPVAPAPIVEPPAKGKAAPKISAKALAAARADLDLDGDD